MLLRTPLLPETGGLDVGALSRLFDDVTTSYKHLFFAALLAEFQANGLSERIFALKSLGLGMLVAAWHPVRVYRLSLGARDQAALVLDLLPPGDDGPVPAARLRASLAAAGPDCGALLRFVPCRLLSPFFPGQLRGVPDHRKDRFIRALADDGFNDVRPLYRFSGPDAIELHPDWAAYLTANFPIVVAWAERRWIAYLQARNPAVPAVSEKLSAPPRRDPLRAQTRYWSKALAMMPEAPRCIYTDRPLDRERFHLDHFLPWTFVCHDSLWNLLPVSPEANISKGNRLPDASYLPAFAASQHAGLTVARRVMTPREWDAATAPFLGELRIPEAALLDAGSLRDSYHRLVGSQLDIARAIGFEPGWRFATQPAA